jgi:23S rRNA (pseudouridine1915-N3)-methyltransferase
MQILVIAVGRQMPAWVIEGSREYTQRLPADYHLHFIEIPAEKRTKNADISQIMQKEEAKILTHLHKDMICIALDRQGKTLDTKMLAHHLQKWHDTSQDICFIIGGPEGLSESFLKKSQVIWSLSALTLPHPMVRVVLSEQIFRAWSIIMNHPYHR